LYKHVYKRGQASEVSEIRGPQFGVGIHLIRRVFHIFVKQSGPLGTPVSYARALARE
jgi:hypothetical protein